MYTRNIYIYIYYMKEYIEQLENDISTEDIIKWNFRKIIYSKNMIKGRICYNHSQRLLGSVPTLEIKYKH